MFEQRPLVCAHCYFFLHFILFPPLSLVSFFFSHFQASPCDICFEEGPCHHAQRHPEVTFHHHHHTADSHNSTGFVNTAFVQDNGLGASTLSVHQTPGSAPQVFYLFYCDSSTALVPIENTERKIANDSDRLMQ